MHQMPRSNGIVRRTKILLNIIAAPHKKRKVDQTDISIVATIIHCIIKYNIMQFSFPMVAILAAFFLTSPVVTAENQIRIGLNKGVASPDMSCTTADFSWIMTTISTLYFPRRNLRQGNVETKDDEPDVDNDTTKTHQERKLPTSLYPASCKTTCQGFAKGTCLALACKGFRRELEATEENDRDLQSSTWCSMVQKIAGMNLDTLSRSQLITNSCRALLQAPRTIECIYNVVC
jgi:hypothetical protein